VSRTGWRAEFRGFLRGANPTDVPRVKHTDTARAGDAQSCALRLFQGSRGFMKIVIAGGTGFLGGPLAEMYAEEGHDVRVLTRSLMSGDTRHDPGTGMPGITKVGWKPDGNAGPWAATLESADAIINLAGESLSAKRWTASSKARIRDSRLLATRSLCKAIAAAKSRPQTLISGSGIDYYPSSDQPVTERDPSGSSFLAQLCVAWEQEARHAEAVGTRVVLLRTAIVLERSGGALPELMRPFKFFAGGPIGSGSQYVSWIHRLDWVEMVRWIVQTPGVSGAVNVSAPQPVTSRHFARALGRALRRPSFIPVPAFALKAIAGEFGEYLLASHRAIPTCAQQHAYHFRYPEIEIAFRGLFGE
jgi:uncharacterized protein